MTQFSLHILFQSIIIGEISVSIQMKAPA